MSLVSDLGCIVCLLFLKVYTPPEIHHTDGKTKEGSHRKILGLCCRHHRITSNDDLWISRHPDKARFEKEYGTEQELMNKTRALLEEGVIVIKKEQK